jgi:SagB-type dehydrogenase family enzyme
MSVILEHTGNSIMKRMHLTQELAYNGLSVEKAIANRRSQRGFTGETMALAELAHLLQYSSGITDKRHGFRAAPSAGATYPIEVYAIVNNIEGLAKGTYHYIISSHELELLREGDFGNEMSRAALQERMFKEANVILALSAVFQRTQQRYRERAQRYICFEAGHIAQNTYLIATSLGLGACAIGAFYDNEFNRLLGLDGKNESVLYIIAVGKI